MDRSSRMAMFLLQLPGSVRQRVLSDKGIVELAAIDVDAKFEVSPGIVFERAKLYDFVRSVVRGKPRGQELEDERQGRWTAVVDVDKDSESIAVIFDKAGRKWEFPYSWCFANDVDARMQGLRSAGDQLNLSGVECGQWEARLVGGALGDDDFDQLVSDFGATPFAFLREVIMRLSDRDCKVTELIPSDEKYYRRLAGFPSGPKMEADHGRSHIQRLAEWNPYHGPSFSLLLSSCRSVSRWIDLGHLADKELVDFFRWLGHEGDLISKIGAVEVALSFVGERPCVANEIASLVSGMLGEEVEAGYRLLSALFVFVDGAMSRQGLLRSDPSYHRRMTAIAHASLLERAIRHVGRSVNDEVLAEMCLGMGGASFFYQTHTDRRLENRWHPDQAVADSIKADFIGRLAMAGYENRDRIPRGLLRQIVLIDQGEGFEGADLSVASKLKVPESFMPGPLEGGMELTSVPPEEVIRKIELGLESDAMDAKLFYPLIACASMYGVAVEHADLVTSALENAGARLRCEDGQDWFVLRGLAEIASLARSVDLQKQVAVLSARLRMKGGVSVTEEIDVCLTAVAANENFEQWCDAVGGWLGAMSSADISSAEAKVLKRAIEELTRITPRLWRQCGRAYANVCSVIER